MITGIGKMEASWEGDQKCSRLWEEILKKIIKWGRGLTNELFKDLVDAVSPCSRPSWYPMQLEYFMLLNLWKRHSFCALLHPRNTCGQIYGHESANENCAFHSICQHSLCVISVWFTKAAANYTASHWDCPARVLGSRIRASKVGFGDTMRFPNSSWRAVIPLWII